MDHRHPSAPGDSPQRLEERNLHSSEDHGNGLRDAAGRLVEEAREKASSAAEHVRESAGSALRSRKNTTADRLHGVAGSFREVGGRLHEQHDDAVAGLVDFAAEQIDCWSRYLRERDLEDLKQDAESAARRHPAIFLGAAFGAGLLLARFMRSSSPREEHDESWPDDRYVAAGATGGATAGPRYEPSYAGSGPRESSMPASTAPRHVPTVKPPGPGTHGDPMAGARGPATASKPLSDERSSTPGGTTSPPPPKSTGAP